MRDERIALADAKRHHPEVREHAVDDLGAEEDDDDDVAEPGRRAARNDGGHNGGRGHGADKAPSVLGCERVPARGQKADEPPPARRKKGAGRPYTTGPRWLKSQRVTTTPAPTSAKRRTRRTQTPTAGAGVSSVAVGNVSASAVIIAASSCRKCGLGSRIRLSTPLYSTNAMPTLTVSSATITELAKPFKPLGLVNLQLRNRSAGARRCQAESGRGWILGRLAPE